jgi:hypothetical protein
MGGGKAYSDGYAKVATATAAPVLTGGSDAEATVGTWNGVTDGSFRVRIDEEWFEHIALDFSGDAAMSDVAATLQTTIRLDKAPLLVGGTNEETSMTVWNAIADGSFEFYWEGVVKQVTALDFTGDANISAVAATIETGIQALGGDLASATFTYDATNEKFVFDPTTATGTANMFLSYLQAHSDGTGTDISASLAMRETSTAPVLNRRGKAASTETVTWSTDHFIFTGPTAGDAYRLSYLTSASTSIGTDISTGTWTDADESAPTSSYVPGTTAKRSVLGQDTLWGPWCEGQRIKGDTDSSETLIGGYRAPDHLLLDADYAGELLFGYDDYVINPIADQVYISELGNPFWFPDENIVKLPTSDNDKVTGIKRMGRNMLICMNHHAWIMDGVDIAAPRILSSRYGSPNAQSMIHYSEGVMVFDLTNFYFVAGGSIQDLDTEGRMQDVVGRLSPNTRDPHGQFIETADRELLVWVVGLDNSSKYGTGIVLEPKTGNFWLWNMKDALSSVIVRDSFFRSYLVTGSSYDSAHSVPAFTFIHGDDYYADGAHINTNYTRQGLVESTASEVATGGNVTGDALRSDYVAAFAAITDGAFSITIDGTVRNISEIDFSSDGTGAAIATTLQAAIRAVTSGSETVTFSTDKFIITSGTVTNVSNVSFTRPYYPTDVTATQIFGKDYLNTDEDNGTENGAVVTEVITLDDMDSVDAALFIAGDGHKGVYVVLCDTNLQNLEYRLITANTADTITITPQTAAVAGWYWFLGGIVPYWKKWSDFNSPQHKRTVHAANVTVDPGQGASGNRMALIQMHDLSSTEIQSDVVALGGTADTVSTVRFKQKPHNQFGLKITRPNSSYDFKIEDITLTHRPVV